MCKPLIREVFKDFSQRSTKKGCSNIYIKYEAMKKKYTGFESTIYVTRRKRPDKSNLLNFRYTNKQLAIQGASPKTTQKTKLTLNMTLMLRERPDTKRLVTGLIQDKCRTHFFVLLNFWADSRIFTPIKIKLKRISKNPKKKSYIF